MGVAAVSRSAAIDVSRGRSAIPPTPTLPLKGGGSSEAGRLFFPRNARSAPGARLAAGVAVGHPEGPIRFRRLQMDERKLVAATIAAGVTSTWGQAVSIYLEILNDLAKKQELETKALAGKLHEH